MQCLFIPADFYQSFYLIVLGIIAFWYYVKINNMPACSIQETQFVSSTFVNILACLVILFIGTRPIAGVFTDMKGYYLYYVYATVADTGEPGFFFTIILGHLLGLPVEGWFTLVAAIFFLSNLMAAKLLDNINGGILFLTFLVAFLTFSYSTNTIRSGMALSILLLGISFHLKNTRREIVIGYVCFICAISVHKSSFLPLLCYLLAYYRLGVRVCLFFWLFSIFISLTIGNQVVAAFQGLGFDDRLDKYLTATNFSGFSRTGFRWDFLVYSIMPIILGYYVVIRKNINDKKYSILLSTYLLANAFWIMVIRAQFSDRFAYLSWFLYPFILCYPLMKFDIWGDRQGYNSFLILMGHLSFTLLMNFVYYQ